MTFSLKDIFSDELTESHKKQIESARQNAIKNNSCSVCKHRKYVESLQPGGSVDTYTHCGLDDKYVKTCDKWELDDEYK